MRAIQNIVVHCSDTPNGDGRIKAYDPNPRLSIDHWHGERGFARRSSSVRKARPELKHFGYHALVSPDGVWSLGRGADETGAHATGENRYSLGVCVVGGRQGDWDGPRVTELTLDAWHSLACGVREWAERFRVEDIMGHRDTPHEQRRPPEERKQCPGFSVDEWLRGGMMPLENHIHQK